jgi:hypothetical protein
VTLYRQTMQERDGSVAQSKWLPAQTVALWLHAVLIQGRRPRRLVLQATFSDASPAMRTLYDSAAPFDEPLTPSAARIAPIQRDASS